MLTHIYQNPSAKKPGYPGEKAIPELNRSHNGENNWDNEHTCVDVGFMKDPRQPEKCPPQINENKARQRRYEAEQIRFQAEGNPNGSPLDQ